MAADERKSDESSRPPEPSATPLARPGSPPSGAPRQAAAAPPRPTASTASAAKSASPPAIPPAKTPATVESTAKAGPGPSAARTPSAGPKTDAVVVAPPNQAPAAPIPKKPDRRFQVATEAIAIVMFLALTIIPLARLGVVQLSQTAQINVLVVASLLIGSSIFGFLKAGYRPRGEVDGAIGTRRRDDAFLNALSIATAVVVFLIGLVELAALGVFLQLVRSTSAAVVLVAGQFVPFVAFTLLFLDLLLIARTSYHSRRKAKDWHKTFGFVLLGASAIVLIISFLKNLDLLNVGPFAGVRPEQSVYVLSFATFLQLLAFKVLLRYPSLSEVFRNEIELARRATKDERQHLERRALRAYVIGLVFVLISFVLIGGIATGRVASGDTRVNNVILVTYVSVAVGILLMVLARFLQHRFLAERARRQALGEVIATRRRSKEEVAALTIYAVSGTLALVSVIVAVLVFMGRTPLKPSLGTDFIIIAFLVGVGPFGFKRGVDLARIRAMDEKFPDFLRDLAEGLRAGMTLPRALHASSKGVYGALTPEIRTMSSQVEWGVSFPEALTRFSQRVKTPLIGRTVALVNEASKAGGNVIDILTAAAADAREIKQIIEDRRRQMGIYSVIIYVAFFVFLVVIFVLAAQFLPSFQTAVQGASGQQVGGLAFAPFKTSTYERLFFHAALIQGIGGGLVAGVMTEGHPVGGLKHSFIMTIISWIFFRVLL